MITQFPLKGMTYDEPIDDPQLGRKRHELITIAAKRLADARMIQSDEKSGSFTITDLGRIAAKYYIRHDTIEIFNTEFRPNMSEADVLAVLCMSSEVSRFESYSDSSTNVRDSLTKFKFGRMKLKSSKVFWKWSLAMSR